MSDIVQTLWGFCHKLRRKVLADVVTILKHAATQWLRSSASNLLKNLSIDEEDFDLAPLLEKLWQCKGAEDVWRPCCRTQRGCCGMNI